MISSASTSSLFSAASNVDTTEKALELDVHLLQNITKQFCNDPFHILFGTIRSAQPSHVTSTPPALRPVHLVVAAPVNYNDMQVVFRVQPLTGAPNHTWAEDKDTVSFADLHTGEFEATIFDAFQCFGFEEELVDWFKKWVATGLPERPPTVKVLTASEIALESVFKALVPKINKNAIIIAEDIEIMLNEQKQDMFAYNPESSGSDELSPTNSSPGLTLKERTYSFTAKNSVPTAARNLSVELIDGPSSATAVGSSAMVDPDLDTIPSTPTRQRGRPSRRTTPQTPVKKRAADPIPLQTTARGGRAIKRAKTSPGDKRVIVIDDSEDDAQAL